MWASVFSTDFFILEVYPSVCVLSFLATVMLHSSSEQR